MDGFRKKVFRKAAPVVVACLGGLVTLPALAAPGYCPKDGPIRFGVEPYEAPTILMPVYQKMGKLLAQKLGCPVKIQITSNYTAEIEAMRHNQLDAGEFGPLGAVLAEKVAGAKIVAQFADAKGKPETYWASIVTWKGSGIHNLSQVKGKTFVYSDPASTSGHLFPAYALKTAGINPDHGVQPFYAGSHTSSFEALVHHKGDAGEFNSQTLELAQQRGWMKNADFKTLWRSEPLPLDAIAINPRIDKTLATKLTQALQHLKFRSVLDTKGKQVMGTQAQLIPANRSDYAYIKKVMDKMNLGMSDL